MVESRRQRFDGRDPRALGDLAQLRSLSLGDNSLTGEIPSELGDLAQLTALLLNANALTGSLPLSLANLSHLMRLFFGSQDVLRTPGPGVPGLAG